MTLKDILPNEGAKLNTKLGFVRVKSFLKQPAEILIALDESYEVVKLMCDASSWGHMQKEAYFMSVQFLLNGYVDVGPYIHRSVFMDLAHTPVPLTHPL